MYFMPYIIFEKVLKFHFQKRRLQGQIPEISSTLDAIQHLIDNNGKEVETSFQLADAVFAKAKVDCQGTSRSLEVKYLYQIRQKKFE